MTGNTEAIDGTVTTERRGPVLVIRMEREAKRNAINRRLAAGIENALNLLEDTPELRVGVLTGTPSVFCAGSDLNEWNVLRMPRGGEYGVIRRESDKPLIAAVEGLALGGGLEIVFACDLVVSSATASFGLPEARRGTLAASGALFRAAKLLTPNVARELLLTGRTLTAERAAQLGFVNEVVPGGTTVDRACVMADEICQAAPSSIRETLRVLRALERQHEQLGWHATKEALYVISESADMKEGIQAFFEKRPPAWSAGAPDRR